MSYNPNTSAFPLDGDSVEIADGQWDGLTKREYFAAKAMVGVLSHNHPANPTPNQAEDIAKYSIAIADEMLKQLEE